MPVKDKSRSTGAAATLRPGTLCIHVKDPHVTAARNTFVVLGPAPRDASGKPRYRVQAIHRQTTFGKIPKLKAFVADAADLLPASAFGMAIAQLVEITRCDGVVVRDVVFRREPGLVPTTDRKWGCQQGATWDWMARSSIDHKAHFSLIRAAMIDEWRDRHDEKEPS